MYEVNLEVISLGVISFSWNCANHHLFSFSQLFRIKPFGFRIWIFNLENGKRRPLDLLLFFLIAEHGSPAIILLADNLVRSLAHKDFTYAERKYEVITVLKCCDSLGRCHVLSSGSSKADRPYLRYGTVNLYGWGALNGVRRVHVGINTSDYLQAGDDIEWFTIARYLEIAADIVVFDTALNVRGRGNELRRFDGIKGKLVLFAGTFVSETLFEPGSVTPCTIPARSAFKPPHLHMPTLSLVQY